LALLLVAPAVVRAGDDIAALGSFSDARALDIEGHVQTIGETPVSVVVFLDTECPVANQYVPELAAMAKRHPEAAIFGVISNASVTRAQALEHRKKFQIEFPEIFDASGELAARLKPTTTPEAFLIREGAIVYRGRIDDRWEKLGRQRERDPKKDLEEALVAAIAGTEIAVPRTEPVGCLFQGASDGAIPSSVTYARDVAPIIAANCTGCHHEGGIGPFALETYEQVKKHAKTVGVATETRYMPPWHAAAGVGHFHDERRLSDREIAIVGSWVKAGMPEGDLVDLPPRHSFGDGWALGEPDAVVSMPQAYEVPASGSDVFRAFVLKVDVPEDRYVTGLEFKPGAGSVVHHCIFYLDNTGAARAKEEKAGGFGYPAFGGPGILPSGSLGGWAPGAIPSWLPDGTGRLLKAGSDIVLQMHYHPSGKAEKDQSKIALYFARKPVSKPVNWIVVGNTRIDIPPGEKDYKRHATTTLPVPVTVIGITPHMHLIGREMKAKAVLPSGEVVPLIDADWDFKWQDQYLYKRPFRLPAGTKIEVEALYDNSTDNPQNPSDPPRRVHFGEQTMDEMCFCFLTVAFDSKADQRKARRAVFEEKFR
jgi:hypothetical protein